MCGRYYVDNETAKEIDKLVRNTDLKLCSKYKGDIFPSQHAVVLHSAGTDLTASEMKWGFARFKKSGLLINARAETLLERPTFKESALHRRCVIPARQYYEWNAQKEKVTFFSESDTTLYMAGVYNIFQEQNHFVIVTTDANSSVQDIHDRMPLLLTRSEIESWIFDDHATDFLLHKTPTLLAHRQDYEQHTLFDLS